jgi:hypothetical protein
MDNETYPTRESPKTDWDIGKAMNGLFNNTNGSTESDNSPSDEDQEDFDEVLDDVEATSDSESEDQDAEGTSTDEPYMVVTVNGHDIVIGSKEEALPLARQGLHYTQEMQKLRDEQRRWEADRNSELRSLKERDEQYTNALRMLNDTYTYVLGDAPPNWNSNELQALKQQNPEQYMLMRDQWDQISAIRAELSRKSQDREQEANQNFQAWVANEQEAIRAKRPEWADPVRLQQDHQMIRDYTNSIGITDQEMNNMYDHRIWLVLHDAARYKQAEATSKQKRTANTGSKTVEPGSGKNINQGNRKIRNDHDLLKKTGDVRVAGNIFQEIMTQRS